MPCNAVFNRDPYAPLVRADRTPTHSTADAEQHLAVKQQIVEFYRKNPTALSLRQLADAIDITEARTADAVADLVFNGVLDYCAPPEHGTYGPTGKVAA